MLDKIKSMAIEAALKVVMGKYGDIKSFKINTTDKTIDAQILLKGEEDISSVSIQGYSFTFTQEQCGVSFEALQTNKEWFNLLANDFLVGKMLPIKSEAACSGLKIFFKND